MTPRGLALLFGTFAAAATAITIAPSSDAGCGPTFCPSYTTCRVAPVAKANPSFSELSALFDSIAPGPSVYGSLGWAYSLKIDDGIGKPHPKTPVDARFPCVLLKAIAVHESVGWHQFCVPTGPTCTGVSQTIISFDCGYGLMQVTSGMRAGDSSSYDANRVASDPAYNVSVGSQILATKWTVTPSVGDNRVDVIEDWYFSVWAYNGLAYSNNPNNPAYPADRKPYRDPGALSAGNYPYQEIIWGLMRVPWGVLEGTGAAYKGYPLSYPNRADICSGCGSPTASIPDPSPTHVTDCPGSGPVASTVPLFEMGATVEGTDRFSDGKSKAIDDVFEGDTYTADLYVKNVGDVGAPAVTLGVWIEEPFVKVTHYQIESDYGSPGTFKINDADARPDNPPHDAPGQTFVLNMNAMAPKENKRVHLTLRAAKYSIGAADHPDVRVWLKDVPGVYSKADFAATPNNVGGAQKWNGGDELAYGQVDVYSHVRWSFDGSVLEGWSPAGAASVSVRDADTSLVIDAKGADPQAIGPDTTFSSTTYGALKLRAKSSVVGGGGPRVYFATKDDPAMSESKAVDVALPADGAFHDVVVDLHGISGWNGTITKLRFDPVPTGTGEVAIDELQMVAADGSPIDDAGPIVDDAGAVEGDAGSADAFAASTDHGACGCRTAGGSDRRAPTAAFVAVGIASLALARRRRLAAR